MTNGVAIVPSRAAASLRAQDLAIGYRRGRSRRVVLEAVNVTTDPGQLICLVGANGSGKSTLLRTLAGMHPPLRGCLTLGGDDLFSIDLREIARRMAVVLTDRIAIDAMPARRIVALGRYPHSGWLGTLDRHDHAAVDAAIHAVDAEDLADRDFALLSDGERQRVMIARALAQEPAVLLLDEPTAFLDAAARADLMRLLWRLTRDGSLTVVASTHDLDLAQRVADAIWLIASDRRLIAGCPGDIGLAGGFRRAFEARNAPGEGNAGKLENITMRSISTMRGDGGETSLAGGVRVSKSSLRVESYGTVDELNSILGFARSICADAEIAALTKGIQQDLFRLGSSLATPLESPKPQVAINQALIDRLTAEVHRLEAIEGILADWSIPGEHRTAAAFDMARTVCRRAERALVRLKESGDAIQPGILPYINRLSDLLWLFARKLERDEGVSASLRDITGKAGNRFSRAW
jgi:iron complex transport system ATP-binding protein